MSPIADLGKDTEAVKVREWRHKLQKNLPESKGDAQGGGTRPLHPIYLLLISRRKCLPSTPYSPPLRRTAR